GRRTGLKIRRGKLCAGSIPASGIAWKADAPHVQGSRAAWLAEHAGRDADDAVDHAAVEVVDQGRVAVDATDHAEDRERGGIHVSVAIEAERTQEALALVGSEQFA